MCAEMLLTLGIRLIELDVWWDCPLFERHDGLDNACQARGSFRVTEIWFDLNARYEL
jgi:hypothetical protein